MPTTISDQSLSAIEAIAQVLLSPLVPDTDGELDDAGATAYEAVFFSDAIKQIREQDGRFPEKRDGWLPEERHLINVFRLGFDLAMEIASRVALDPLGNHNAARVVEPFRERYIGERAASTR